MAADRLRANDGRAAELPADEQSWSGAYSPKAMIGPAILAALATVAGALGAPLTRHGGWFVWYRLTNFSFFHDRGIVSTTSNRIQVIDIDDITVHQGAMERMLGVGTIVLQTADRTEPELRLRGIDDVADVADLIDAARRAERNRRGLYVQQL
jgi:hypothetical protein